jgi:hypothetical protein
MKTTATLLILVAGLVANNVNAFGTLIVASPFFEQKKSTVVNYFTSD